MSARRTERGISALEALAALALLAIVLVPLLELQSQIARQSIAQDAAARRHEAQRNALTLLETVNPTVTPDGILPMGPGIELRWRSEPRSAETRSLAYPAGDGMFLVRLYAVSVTITGSGLNTGFTVERLGWRPAEDDVATSVPEPAAAQRGFRRP